jgi:hypothetical protein
MTDESEPSNPISDLKHFLGSYEPRPLTEKQEVVPCVDANGKITTRKMWTGETS